MTTLTKTRRNRVFAIRVGKELLFNTITSNPAKTVRFYKRLGRKSDPVGDTFLSELEMRRKVTMQKKEVHIGPMR